MDNFLLTDLGIVCLVFWGAIGAFLIWYAWKLKEFNLGQDADQQFEDEGNEKGPLLLENLQEGEIDDLGPTQPDHSEQ